MVSRRVQRGLRAYGGFMGGTSRLARPHQRLSGPDIRPCVGPSPLLIHDNFDRGSYPSTPLGTSTSGHTWTAYRGGWTIDLRDPPLHPEPNNSFAYLTSQGPSGSAGFAGFDYGTTDVHLAARCAAGSGDSSRGIFLCYNFGAVGSESYYFLNADGGTLSKIVGATATTIANSPGAQFDGDVLEVIKSGATFELYVNGVLEDTGTDGGSLLTATRHGLRIRFDDELEDGFYDWGYPYNPCDPEAFA